MPAAAVQVRYARAATPVGPLWVACSSRGVLRISWRATTEKAFLADLRSLLRPEPLLARRGGAAVNALARQVEEYFGGGRRVFTLAADLRRLTPFRRKVLAATARVPFGRVVSYGEIASAIGQPGATRAVGSALGANPVPILIPCHRVVASDGTLGGFTGGVGMKRSLLRVEGIAL